MRPLLLDTCAALAIVANEITPATATVLNETRSAGFLTYVSPFTAWEVGMLARKGRFKSAYSPQRWFEQLMSVPDTALAGLTPEILLASSFLPGTINGDPADRILAATAREYGYTLMTRDRDLLRYAKEGHLSAIEC